MKATVLQNDFNLGLNIVSRYVSTKGQLPILANILISATNEGLCLSATNLSISAKTNIGGKISEIGQTTVGAKILLEFINSLPAGQIDLSLEKEKLKISCGKFKAVFSTQPAQDFPLLSNLTASEKRLMIKNDWLFAAAAQVGFAASVDDSRPVLTGIRIQYQDKMLTMVATDGFRLSQKQLKTDNWQLATDNLILPARAIIEVVRLVENSKSVEMVFLFESKQVVFILDNTEIVVRTLEGNFPQTEKIIPQDFSVELTLDRQELVSAIRSAGIFARENNTVVVVNFVDEKAKIEASGGASGENIIEVETEQKGENLKTAFNYKFLLDFLGSINSERVIIKANAPTSPVVFVPEDDPSLLHLIMPVRV